MDEFYGYDPDLKLVGELYRHLEEERRTQAGRKKQWDSPYLLNGFRKVLEIDGRGKARIDGPMRRIKKRLIQMWDWDHEGKKKRNKWNHP